LPPGRATDRVDGVFVGLEVALCVGFGQRSLAEHVVGVAKAFGLHLARTLQGFIDGFAGDELLAQHLHGQLHALADQRLAALAHQAGERAQHLAFAVGGDQLAGQQQAP